MTKFLTNPQLFEATKILSMNCKKNRDLVTSIRLVRILNWTKSIFLARIFNWKTKKKKRKKLCGLNLEKKSREERGDTLIKI